MLTNTIKPEQGAGEIVQTWYFDESGEVAQKSKALIAWQQNHTISACRRHINHCTIQSQAKIPITTK